MVRGTYYKRTLIIYDYITISISFYLRSENKNSDWKSKKNCRKENKSYKSNMNLFLYKILTGKNNQVIILRPSLIFVNSWFYNIYYFKKVSIFFLTHSVAL